MAVKVLVEAGFGLGVGCEGGGLMVTVGFCGGGGEGVNAEEGVGGFGWLGGGDGAAGVGLIMFWVEDGGAEDIGGFIGGVVGDGGAPADIPITRL